MDRSRDSEEGAEAAILARLIRQEESRCPAEVAQALIGLRFDDRDLDRMHELVTRNQDDALTLAERAELENYRRVGFFLDLLHSKARRAGWCSAHGRGGN